MLPDSCWILRSLDRVEGRRNCWHSNNQYTPPPPPPPPPPRPLFDFHAHAILSSFVLLTPRIRARTLAVEEVVVSSRHIISGTRLQLVDADRFITFQ